MWSKWFKEIFQDVNGAFSNKRTITSFAFILCSVAFIANLFWGFSISQFIYENMVYIVIGGIGLTVPEYLSKRINPTKKDHEEE